MKHANFEAQISNRCSAVMDLLRNPWFTRSWVVQEYVLGGHRIYGRNDIVICCGELCVPNFISIFSLVDLYNFPLYEHSLIRMKVVHNSLDNMRGKYNMMMSTYKTKQRSFVISKSAYLLQCLASFMVSGATDPRDKIYSWLGLVDEQYNKGESSPDGWGALIVDYITPVEDVWSSFVKEVVQSTKRLDILGFCEGQRSENCGRTWVLNCLPKGRSR